MNNRRQFLGAAAAALGLVRFETCEARSLESGDGFVETETWEHSFTKEFRGVRYSPVRQSGFAWADTRFVTIDTGVAGDGVGDLFVEFREEDSRHPDVVTDVAFSTRFSEPEYGLELSTFSEVDVATARELAHIILEETEPVGGGES